MQSPRRRSWLVVAPLVGSAACSSLSYDLASVPVPVSASPAPAGAKAEPFTVRTKSVLWIHGLFGAASPDVAAIVRDAASGAEAIADFRVEVAASGHDWFLTHLTLGFLRMKTVTVRGVRVATAR